MLVRFTPRRCALLACLLAVVACWPAIAFSKTRRAAADLVLRGGAVYTLAPERPWAEAVAVSGGRIVFVGTDRDAAEWIGPKTRVVDLGGKMVLPGFHDTHVHPVSSGVELGDCQLSELTTEQQVLDAVRDWAAKNPARPWVRGTGWQLFVFPNANPQKAALDRVAPDRPALLWAADGHSAWANSKALAMAGITRATPDPPNGRIERDPATGEPSGTLRESATALVSKIVPEYTPDEYLEGLRGALALANAAGITTLFEANARERDLKAYTELERRGGLTARVRAALRTDAEKGVEQIAGLEALRRKYRTALVRPEAVKIFADGVIEAHTAALVDPYVGEGAKVGRGTPNLQPAALDAFVTELDRRGFQVHVHAIGDGGVRMTLDAFERARAANGVRDSRHMIAHLELIDPRDVPRFRKLGVVADFQPLWAYRDKYITDLTEPVLGPDRSARIYPIGSLVRSGAVWSFGSDWSVSSIAPLDAIQVAVTRRALDAGPGQAWLAEERIGLPEALAGYTVNAAYADFLGDTGTIAVGKQADLVVLDRNLFDVAPHEIHDVKVVFTFLAGREVFRR